MSRAAFDTCNPDFEQRVRKSFSRQGAMTLIGARITHVSSGRCDIELDWRADLTQQHGFFHGGILSAIADSAAGYAGYTLMPADTTVLTIEYKTNFLAPAKGDRLIARGHVVKPGRTVTVAEARTFVVNGGVEKLCATLTETLMTVTHQPEHGQPESGSRTTSAGHDPDPHSLAEPHTR